MSMESPFNFPMELVTRKGETMPAPVTVHVRTSQSRRPQSVVTLLIAPPAKGEGNPSKPSKALGITELRLGMN
jgi:hypothetical protein